MRCGECLSIFDALEELRSAADLESEERKIAARRSAAMAGRNANNTDSAALDVTYSDFDLFSAEADLPEIAYFDQTRDTPDFDFDAVELGNDETFSDTLFVHDVTIDADATALRAKPSQPAEKTPAEYAEIDFVADAQPREPLIFKYRDGAKKPATSSSSVSGLDKSGDRDTEQIRRRIEISADGSEKSGAADTLSFGDDHQMQVSGTVEPSAVAPERVSDNGSVTSDVLTDSSTERQAIELEGAKRRSPWLFRGGMLGLLLLLLGGLFAYRMQPQLYNNATMRPILEAGCNLIGCTIPARVDVDSVKMVKRNVYSHPSTPNALVINVSFRNDAEFAQQLPLLRLVLSNRVGRTVAKQDFAPPDYFQNWSAGSVIDAKEQLDVKLEITDPGQDAQSFEFNFLEYKP